MRMGLCAVWDAVWVDSYECFPIARETKSLKASCLGQCCLHQNSIRGFGAYTKSSFWTDTQGHMIVIKSLNKNLHNKVVLE